MAASNLVSHHKYICMWHGTHFRKYVAFARLKPSTSIRNKSSLKSDCEQNATFASFQWLLLQTATARSVGTSAHPLTTH